MTQDLPRSARDRLDGHDPTVDPSVFNGTSLAGLPPEVAASLLRDAVVDEVPAGGEIFPGDDGQTHMGMLLAGVARSFLTAADGRQLTVRYARAGSLTSRRTGMSGDQAPLRIQAVTACRIVRFDRDAMLASAKATPSVAMALIDELSGRLLEIYATVADTAFGSMRQRVARHLLALAGEPAGDGRKPVAAVTQQQLADGIGASREAVARMLAVLREEGLIRTAPREIELLDARRLTSFLGEWRTEGRRIEPDLTFEAERLLQASPNAVVVVDREGLVVFANQSAERIFGWSAATLLGRPVEVLLPEGKRHLHAGLREKFLEAPRARPMGLGRELLGRRHDGSEFPLAASLTTVDTRDGALVIATVVELGANGGASGGVATPS